MAMHSGVLFLLWLGGGAAAAWTPGDPEADRPHWMNREGGPAHPDGMAMLLGPDQPPSAPPPPSQTEMLLAPSGPEAPMFPHTDAELAIAEADAAHAKAASPYNYTWQRGFFRAGNDLGVINVTSVKEALDACTALLECKGFCYTGNETIDGTTTEVYLKTTATISSHAGGAVWSSWTKSAIVGPSAAQFSVGGLDFALRASTFTMQELNKSGTNYSFVPALTPRSGLPLTQMLGDVTLRVKPASADDSVQWAYFASAWAPGSATATAVTPLPKGAVAAHDISALLSATNVDGVKNKSPLKVVRAYSKAADGGPGLEMSFEITNQATQALRLGSFGMPTPSAGGTGNIETNIALDAHIGGEHAWVEWVRVVVDEQTLIATPLNKASKMEAWRPILEFGSSAEEWATLTAAWAPEWAMNRQWPYYYMSESLNATGFWPDPKSPWPCWADGGKTVRTNFTADLNWNPPTDLVLQPGDSVTYGMRFSAAAGGPRTRDAALEAVGEPVLRSVPGYTLSTDMKSAKLFITPPRGATVTNVTSSSKYLRVGARTSKQGKYDVVMLEPVESRGRARVAVGFSDGSEAVAHYYVLPSLEGHLESVGKHWSEVAWLPREYPDPFGRGASVLPWDREDSRHRLNDPRAYDVGLSDDAGGGNPLGFATKVTYAPTQKQVATLDEYVGSTLYGIKDKPGDGAKPPYKALQVGGDPATGCSNLTHPPKGVDCDGIRMTMFYYNQTHFPWNYTEEHGCGSFLDNWCMTEGYANATYRKFNNPHQIASFYGMYRTARNHDKMKVEMPWEFYLERAAMTVLRMGNNNIGFMDGTIQREVLRSVLEEDAAAGGNSRWTKLGKEMLANQLDRAKFWSTAKYPYGSEFAYDTTGQEEVVVWLLYFGYDDAAERTVNHILSYMRSLPGWFQMGGAIAGDIGNGGKWYAAAETAWPNAVGKMHYRAGLNQIPLSEWYRLHPDDFQLLEISMGAITGQYTNIDETGAPGMMYNSFPHIQEHDPYSGDYGLGFFGISLESGGYFVNHKTLGPLCYLCDISSTDLVLSAPAAARVGGARADADGGADEAAARTAVSGSFSLTDAYRQRFYFEPLGLWVQSDAGRIDTVAFNLNAKTLSVTFQAAKDTPAGEQSYSVLRLRADKVARGTSRPGNNFTLAAPTVGVTQSRSAWEIVPPKSPAAAATVTLTWKE